MPIHHRKIQNVEWNPVECRFVSKLGCWEGKLDYSLMGTV
jgi:hypothetical protein